ncbi:MAG: hypothetical protein SFY66_26650 [Oculatellaceae cyanobacterium bins.114]|nr:hypothetical protein [Oculatellaceae cyanobacterium bins.114]
MPNFWGWRSLFNRLRQLASTRLDQGIQKLHFPDASTALSSFI